MINKVLHILLAFNLLISSMGVTAFEHICQKNGTTLAYFVKSHNCCSQKKQNCSVVNNLGICQTSDSGKQGVNIKKKPCCEDRSYYKKLNTNASEFEKITLIELYPVSNSYWINSSILEHVQENEKTVRFYLYKPPPIYKDHRVLYQSFLC